MSRAAIFTISILSALGPPNLSAQLTPTLKAERSFVIEGKASGLMPGATRLQVSANGSMAISDVQSSRIRIVKADGSKIYDLANMGDSENDFSEVQWYGWVGATDSIWVADVRKSRIMILTPEGKSFRSFPIPVVPNGMLPWQMTPGRTPIVQEVLADGSLLLNAWTNLPVQLQAGQNIPFLVHTTSTGNVLDFPIRPELGAVRQGVGCEQRAQMANGQNLSIRKLFCSIISDATSGTGNAIARIQSIDTSKSTFRLVKQSPRGDTLFQKNIAFVAEPVTALEFDSAAAKFANDPPPMDPPEIRKFVDSVRRATPVKMHQPVLRIVAGIDSTTWVELFTKQPGHLWQEFDGTGNTVGMLTVPDSIRITKASRGAVWASEYLTKDEINFVRLKIVVDTSRNGT